MSQRNIFQASESTIGNLFSGQTVYVIPNYQRPYAWEEKHISALWKDIIDTLEQAKQLGATFLGYFVGALYTRDLNKSDLDQDLINILEGSQNVLNSSWVNKAGNQVNFVEVLDGQQRLITLFLLRQRLGLSGGMITLSNGKVITPT